jgi:hypothetical protein
MVKRKRRVHSIKEELLCKSREAALAAVQVFNNPNITFKAEIFVVLMHIAWTYLLHAYYRAKGVEYRYCKIVNVRRRFDRTKAGAFKYWELERCINCDDSPLDQPTAINLRFLIGLRHEIEHQMTTRIDDYVSARFQATCLNYNRCIKALFGDKYGIDQHQAFSLQLASLTDEQINTLRDATDLPPHIYRFIEGFDRDLTDEEFNDPRYAYRVLFVSKSANRKGQADRVIEFVAPDSPLAESLNTEYAIIKEREKPKHLPGRIVQRMQDEGYVGFNMHHHTQLWKTTDARNPGKGYGIQVENTWYWYDKWVDAVRKHCNDNRDAYR